MILLGRLQRRHLLVTFWALLVTNKNVCSLTDSSSYLLTPCEVFMDSVTRVAIQELKTQQNLKDNSTTTTTTEFFDSNYFATTLSPCYYPNDQSLTLTLCGSKGGGVYDQINQDRAFVYKQQQQQQQKQNAVVVLSGVLDGHGPVGHLVAEWSRHEIIQQFLKSVQPNDNKDDIPKKLTNLFIQTDQRIPHKIAMNGGATASLIFQIQDTQQKQKQKEKTTSTDQNTQIYFCNAGDSRSFLAAAIVTEKTTTAHVVFATRLDTPNIPEERQRILQVPGMKVESHKGDDARIWYTSAKDNQFYGLAMSRGLGDREATGVIAEPIITQFDKHSVIQTIVQKVNGGEIKLMMMDECEMDTMTGTCASTSSSNITGSTIITPDQVHLFVVSATDGVMDYMTPQQIADAVGPSMIPKNSNKNNSKHLVLAAEELLLKSATQWHMDMQGKYRDDMALAITPVI